MAPEQDIEMVASQRPWPEKANWDLCGGLNARAESTGCVLLGRERWNVRGVVKRARESSVMLALGGV